MPVDLPTMRIFGSGFLETTSLAEDHKNMVDDIPGFSWLSTEVSESEEDDEVRGPWKTRKSPPTWWAVQILSNCWIWMAMTATKMTLNSQCEKIINVKISYFISVILELACFQRFFIWKLFGIYIYCRHRATPCSRQQSNHNLFHFCWFLICPPQKKEASSWTDYIKRISQKNDALRFRPWRCAFFLVPQDVPSCSLRCRVQAFLVLSVDVGCISGHHGGKQSETVDAWDLKIFPALLSRCFFPFPRWDICHTKVGYELKGRTSVNMTWWQEW